MTDKPKWFGTFTDTIATNVKASLPSTSVWEGKRPISLVPSTATTTTNAKPTTSTSTNNTNTTHISQPRPRSPVVNRAQKLIINPMNIARTMSAPIPEGTISSRQYHSTPTNTNNNTGFYKSTDTSNNTAEYRPTVPHYPRKEYSSNLSLYNYDYDETIVKPLETEGKGFIIGEVANTMRVDTEMSPQPLLKLSNANEIANNQMKLSDYDEAETLKFKKVKKRKNLKRSAVEIDRSKIDLNAIDVDDDFDLQAMLNKTRKLKLIRNTPTFIDQVEDETEKVETKGGIIISETTEFVDLIPLMDTDDEITLDLKRDDAETMLEDNRLNEIRKSTEVIDESPSLSSETKHEHLVGDGIASTLRLLQQQGIKFTPSDTFPATKVTQKKQSTTTHQPKQSHISKRQKEELLLQQQIEKANSYKPNVHISHKDKTGRELSAKEAYVELSRAFHGKMPGKRKEEKEKKRKDLQVVKEKREMVGSAGQESGGLEKVLKESKRKFIVLGQTSQVSEPTKRNDADALSVNVKRAKKE